MVPWATQVQQSPWNDVHAAEHMFIPMIKTAVIRKAFAFGLAAAVFAITLAVLPADAARKQKPRPRPEASSSLDGRVLGYPRTCGYDHFQYSTTGTPVGPYCH